MEFPNISKQKCCCLCGDSNILLSGENAVDSKDCGTSIPRGEQQCGIIGIDGSFVGKMVEIFNENMNK